MIRLIVVLLVLTCGCGVAGRTNNEYVEMLGKKALENAIQSEIVK